MSNGGTPVGRSKAAETGQSERAVAVTAQNYLTIVETLKANNGAEAKQIRAMFGGDKRLMDSFLATCFNLLQSNPAILRDCDPMSLIQAIKDAASLGLVPMTDDAAIIPYGAKATLVPMWRGYVKRIRNSRQVVDLDIQVVYTEDVFELSLGTNPSLKHIPVLGEERGGYRGVYAWALMPSGVHIIEWMTEADINYVRDTWGNKGKDSPWNTSWAEMARKTVIRRLAKRLPAAAVDRLLELDKAADGSDTEEQIARLDTGLAEVRRLALRAVADEQDAPSTPRTNEDARNTGEHVPVHADHPTGQDGGKSVARSDARPQPEAPPVDPDVDSAMRLAQEQQEQLARQRNRR